LGGAGTAVAAVTAGTALTQEQPGITAITTGAAVTAELTVFAVGAITAVTEQKRRIATLTGRAANRGRRRTRTPHLLHAVAAGDVVALRSGARVTAVAEQPAGVAAAAVVAIAVAAITEQPAGVTAVGVGRGAIEAVTDHIR